MNNEYKIVYLKIAIANYFNCKTRSTIASIKVKKFFNITVSRRGKLKANVTAHHMKLETQHETSNL